MIRKIALLGLLALTACAHDSAPQPGKRYGAITNKPAIVMGSAATWSAATGSDPGADHGMYWKSTGHPFARYSDTTEFQLDSGVPPAFVLADPDKLAGDTIAQCGGGHGWYANPAGRATTNSGTRFQFLLPATVTGVRFFSAVTTATAYACKLWNPNGTVAASGTVSTTGVAHYTCTFSSPFSAIVGGTYHATVYGGDTGSGTTTTRLDACSGSMNSPTVISSSLIGGVNLVWGAWGDDSNGAGDAFPNNASTNVYPVMPIFTIP